MKCHICSRDAAEVRSVMLRQWRAGHEARGVPEPPPPAGAAAYEQFCKNMKYRRAFICESCYQIIDADPGGCAEILGFGQWNLAGSSRGGRAAVYDRAKWERFQRSKAKSMDIDW